MKNLARHLNPANIPQTAPLNSTQVKNTAGGFVYGIDCFSQLRRFLILGSVGGTYYVSEATLTTENADVIRMCFAKDAERTFTLIEEVSSNGLAPKNDYAILALAIACTIQGLNSDRRKACAKRVLRTGTHLFQFLATAQELRGWGNGLKKVTQSWYIDQERNALAYQLVKYRNRENWTHKDALRLSHVHADKPNNDLRLWALRGTVPTENVPPIIEGFEKLKGVTDPKVAAGIIAEYRLPHEAVPTELQASPVVLSALLQHMPLMATVRQLARLTRARVLELGNADAKLVKERLMNATQIERSKIHPFHFLLANMTYSKGQGFVPIPAICEALEAGFHAAFKNAPPTGRNYLLAIDVSGSMTSAGVAGMKDISAREAAAACALTITHAEENTMSMAFSNQFVKLDLTKRSSLADVLKKTGGLPFSGTDCSLPMLYASQNKLPIDAFVVFTDNETFAGAVHPSVALKQYNQQMGRNARLIVQAFSPTKFSIAEPGNPNMLDIVGMDSSSPKLISDFMANLL